MMDNYTLLQEINYALEHIREKLNSGTEAHFLYKQCADKLNIIKKDIIQREGSNQGVSLGQFAIKRIDLHDTLLSEKLCHIASILEHIEKTSNK